MRIWAFWPAVAILGGCVQYAGAPSMGMISDQYTAKTENLERVGAPVTVERCLKNALFVAWGESGSFEGIVSDILDDKHAELLVDVTLKYTSIPAVVYRETCATVTGQPMKFKPPPPPPPPPPPEPPVEAKKSKKK